MNDALTFVAILLGFGLGYTAYPVVRVVLATYRNIGIVERHVHDRLADPDEDPQEDDNE